MRLKSLSPILLFVCSPLFAAGASDACSLLTPAGVGKVLGVTVTAGKSGLPYCDWDQAGNTKPDRKRASLQIVQPKGKRTPVDQFANPMPPSPGVTKLPLSGVGDDSYYMSSEASGTYLLVKKGSTVFRVRVFGVTTDQAKAMEKTLAQDVVGKL